MNLRTAFSLLTFSFLLISGSSFADSVLGKWKLSDPITGTGGKAWVSYEITTQSFNQIVRCEFTDGVTLSTEADGDAQLSADSIEVYTPGEGVNDDGTHRCSASVPGGTYHYELSGQTLTLKFNEKTITLQRE